MKKLTPKQIDALKALQADGNAKVNGHTVTSLAGCGLIRWQKEGGGYLLTPSGRYLLELDSNPLPKARPQLPDSGSRFPPPAGRTRGALFFQVALTKNQRRIYEVKPKAFRDAEYLHGDDCGCSGPEHCLRIVLEIAGATMRAVSLNDPETYAVRGWYCYAPHHKSLTELPPELARYAQGEPLPYSL